MNNPGLFQARWNLRRLALCNFVPPGAAGLLVMAYRSDAVCDFRRVAVSSAECAAGQQPDMATHLGDCKSAPIRCGEFRG